MPGPFCKTDAPPVLRLVRTLGAGLLASLLLAWGLPLAHAQQPDRAQSSVIEQLKEQGSLDQIPVEGLREHGQTEPRTLQTRRTRAKATFSNLQIRDALQRNGGSRFPRSDLNVRPDNTPIPAGDVDGDGVNDWIYKYFTADNRTNDPSDTTPKTFLRFGGGDFSAQYFDEFYFRDLIPAGNLVGSDNADAIELIGDGNEGFRVLEGGAQGYEEVDERFTGLPPEVVSAADLDGDGHDDLVFGDLQTNEITVIFGAQDPADIEVKSFAPSHDGNETYTYTTGDIDDNATSVELVRLAGGDRNDPPEDSMVVDVFEVNSARELSSRQEFGVRNPEGDIVREQAGFVTMELANIDGTGGKELLLRSPTGFPSTSQSESFVFPFSDGSFEETPVRYRAGIRHVGDVDGDGKADFAVRGTGGPFIAFGPDNVSDGLSLDLSIGSASGRIDLPSIEGLFSDEQNRLGDLTGNGRADLIVQRQTTSEFGPRLISVTTDRSIEETPDVVFDTEPYNTSAVEHTVALGDWGGDGTDDVAFLRRGFDFGAKNGGGVSVGGVDLYFGDPTTAMSPDLTLTHPNNAAPALAVTGDFTGNGTQNLAVSWRDSSSTIEIYEAGGGNTPVHSIDYGDLASGIESTQPSFSFASSIGNVGDVNNDGVDDLLVGVAGSNMPGSAFLFLGGDPLSDQPDLTVDLSGLAFSGSNIEGAGDLNGDGVDDFAVGGGANQVLVFFGEDGSPDFSAADLTIAASGVSFFGLPMASGDFNADGTPDLAVSSFRHQNNNGEGTAAIRIYHGGSGFDATPERELLAPGPPLGAETENLTRSLGEMTALPDFNGDGSDELLFGTAVGRTNALIYAGNGTDAPEPSILLRAPDQTAGLGANNNDINNNNRGSAVGQFNGDGTLEAVVPQEGATGFRDAPVYTYQPGAAGGEEEEPVVSDTASVDSTNFGSEIDLGETGTSITLSDSSGGSGQVSADRFDGPPEGTGTIEQRNVAEVRIELTASEGLTVGDSSEVRFDTSMVDGINDPTRVTIVTREIPGVGTFSELETTFDADAGELVATVDGFSEFAFASNTEPLPVEMAGFEATVDGDAVRLTWQTASETGNAGFEVQRQKEESWTQVGFVESKAQGGTTTQARSYEHVVADLSVGRHRFRLRQVDLDGSSTLTDTVGVRVRMQEPVKLGTVAPNPASEEATFAFAVQEPSETTIRLYDTLGRRVRTVYRGTPQVEQKKRVRFDVSTLPSGKYFLRLETRDRSKTQRLTVVK